MNNKMFDCDYESLMENIDQAMMVTEAEDETKDISLCDEALEILNSYITIQNDRLRKDIRRVKEILQKLKAREEAEQGGMEESTFPIHEAEVAPPVKIGRCSPPNVPNAYYDPGKHACLDKQTDKPVVADEKKTCPPGYQPIPQTKDCKIIDQKTAQEYWHGAQKESTHKKRKQAFTPLDYRAPYKGINWQ